MSFCPAAVSLAGPSSAATPGPHCAAQRPSLSDREQALLWTSREFDKDLAAYNGTVGPHTEEAIEELTVSFEDVPFFVHVPFSEVLDEIVDTVIEYECALAFFAGAVGQPRRGPLAGQSPGGCAARARLRGLGRRRHPLARRPYAGLGTAGALGSAVALAQRSR